MAYENYSFVSWSGVTPITSERLQQMSTNISQVKDATDDNPKGLLKLKTVTSGTFGPYTNFNTENEIIALENEGGGGVNNLVTVGANRYYRFMLSFPGVTINNAGAEDSTFLIRISEGTTSAPVEVVTWKVTPHTYSFINVASANANIANHTLKAPSSYPSKIGAGTYSYVADSLSSGITNKRYYVSVIRDDGTPQVNNAPSFSILGTEKIQFYVEDIGGSV